MKSKALILLQLMCATAVGLGVEVWAHTQGTALTPELRTFAWLIDAGYLVCALALLWRERRARPLGFDALISTLAVCVIPAIIFSLHAHGAVPTQAVVAELVWCIVLAVLTVALRRRPGARAASLAAIAIVGLALSFVAARFIFPVKPGGFHSVRTWRLDSALYPLKVTEYRSLIAPSKSKGGAVAALRDHFVVANGHGDLFLINQSGKNDALNAQRLQPSVPINWDQFAKEFVDSEDFEYFRTADLLVQDLGDKVRLFATHHFWKLDQRCFVVRVSMLETQASRLLQADTGGAAWKTIFESTPCVRLEPTGPLAHFGGIQIGGQLALLNSHELLVTMGDHEHDGVNAPDSFPQDTVSSYGKTIRIELTDFSSHPFSMGHRNPEGLFADGANGIWLTEHGPQGGDELNLVQQGANYGWPLATYGTQYGAHFWPGNPTPGSHSGFAEPFYSWVPSIGVSSVLVVHGQEFKLWDRDLIVISLRDGSIYRARVRDARIVMLERIALGRRLRDITEGTNGDLVILTDKDALLQIRQDNDVSTGETLFRSCTGCHMIGDGKFNGIGPDLRKVVNRPVAAVADYRYSSALTKLNGRWTRERLDMFLANPKGFAPGTKMKFAGITDAHDRLELIDFLASGTITNPPAEDEP